jgi:hypothetical protein
MEQEFNYLFEHIHLLNNTIFYVITLVFIYHQIYNYSGVNLKRQ